MKKRKNKQVNEGDPDKQVKQPELIEEYDFSKLDFEERKDLSAGEKMKDFVSDHSDSLGCLATLSLIAVLCFGANKAYKYIDEKKECSRIEMQMAEADAPKMEEIYLRTLLPLASKITKENAPRVFNAIKHLLLIDYPDKGKAFDLLNKKYEKAYQEANNGVYFESFLIHQLRHLHEERKEVLSTNKTSFLKKLQQLNKRQMTRQ